MKPETSGPWLIVHPGTGTIISLSDPVFILDTSALPMPTDLDNDDNIVRLAQKYGYRIDNHSAHHMYYTEG